MKIVYCSSKSEPNTWYVFRDNGVEVVVKIIENKIKSDKDFTDLELEFLKKTLK